MELFERQSRAALRGVLILVFVLGSIGAAGAASARQGRGACREDVAKYCKDVQRGGGRIVQCLKEHESDLSPACQERIAQAKEKMQGFKQACRGDVESYCKDVQPGGGRIISCLKEHEDQLSSACSEMLSKAKPRRRQ